MSDPLAALLTELDAALAADGVAARLAGQAVRRFVCVPGQVVNLVVD